jgi:hypothetical protein
MSREKALEQVWFDELKKGHVYKNCEVVRVDDTGILIKRPNGRYSVYGRHFSPNKKIALLGWGLEGFAKSVMQGLVKIGALTKEQVDNHIAGEEYRRETRDARYAVERIRKACEELGVKVPAKVDKIDAELKAKACGNAEG